MSRFVFGTMILAVIHLYSCGPKIYQFNVESKVISSSDSIRVHWKTRGKPTLLIHEKFKTVSNDSFKIEELTLVSERANKQVRQFQQVEIRNDELVDSIVFSTQLEGDSVIVAKGSKSAARWNKFQIMTVSNPSGRPLLLIHSGRLTLLPPYTKASEAFITTAVAGDWEFRTALTDAEKRDPSRLPPTLKIITFIKEVK